MYTIRKKHMDIEIVTILVYAENRNTLWEYCVYRGESYHNVSRYCITGKAIIICWWTVLRFRCLIRGWAMNRFL